VAKLPYVPFCVPLPQQPSRNEPTMASLTYMCYHRPNEIGMIRIGHGQTLLLGIQRKRHVANGALV